MIDGEFGNWLAGFIDGEGCFIIQQLNHTPKNGRERTGNYMARFHMNLRDDDVEILKEIIARTGIGVLGRRPPSKPTEGGQVNWQVAAKAEVMMLVNILDAHPLRAKKKEDYRLWREAVIAWCQTEHGKNNGEVWKRMAQLKDELSRTRSYVPVGPDGLPVVADARQK